MRFSLVLFSCLSLGSAAARAQTNAERMATDRYSRSHDYDLVHQRIELRGFDWDSLAFRGRATLTFRVLRSGFDSVILDAGELLQVRAVTAVARVGAPAANLSFSRVRDTLVVRLPKPAAFGDTVRFTVAYDGRVRNGMGLMFIEADSLPPRRPRQLWSQGEDHNNHYWFPTYDFPNDKATWEVIATVPRGFTAVSNGRLALDRVNRDGTRTLHWRQEQPSVTYLVSLIVAPLARIPDRWRGIPVDYYVYREDSAGARRLFGATPDMIEVYSRLTGVPYPWPKYAQTTVADFLGGMENVSATTLVDWIPDSRAWADRPWFGYILIPHELAHQWFGDYVTTANWANMWLNEGFAEFLPGQYWAERLGAHAEEDYYLDEYEQFMGIDGRRRMPLAALGSNNIYPKGALVLWMLEKQLGRERFWAGVRRYLETHAFGVATTDDLRQAMLAATGENLDWFWDQWMYQAGYPEFDVSAAWDSTAGAVTLRVAQTQRDTLRADSTGLRYSVPEVFRMPITIRIGIATDDVVYQAQLSAREQEIRVPGIASPPTMVVFDDGNRILKQLSFEQPTSWLATQLRRDPDLWNRAWVIGQLAARSTDSVAADALALAARSADYFLTRSQAAEALAVVPGLAARAALLSALRDTSSRVRAAAVQALGARGEVEVVPQVRGTWELDTSYTVRAAALNALVRLAPDDAHGVLQEGLRTPSYQDVIAEAALRGIAERGDTALLDEVDAAVARLKSATYVLAALAARGASGALDRLDRHAVSPREAERKRARQAYRFALPAEVARERLSRLAGTVPPGKIRSELEGELVRLRQ